MAKVSFRTNAELKSIIGKDLITDDNIAVLELVKNSFDVDMLSEGDLAHKYDAIILAVPHQQILTTLNFESFKNAGAFVYDVKGVLPKEVIDGRL